MPVVVEDAGVSNELQVTASGDPKDKVDVEVDRDNGDAGFLDVSVTTANEDCSGCSSSRVDDTFVSTCSHQENEELICNLKHRLASAEMELALKAEKCGKLQEMQENVDSEIQELTASLFQEAYRIAAEANDRRALTEKLLQEANGKVEVLQAEVEALKIIVLASNVSLNISQPDKKHSSSESKSKLPFLTHKRDSSNGSSLVKQSSYDHCMCSFPESHELGERVLQAIENNTIILEPVSLEEKAIARSLVILRLKLQHAKEFTLVKVYAPIFEGEYETFLEEVQCVLSEVPNTESLILMGDCNAHVEVDAEKRNGVIGKNGPSDLNNNGMKLLRCCVLTGVPRLCSYRMKTDNNDQWMYISTLCRNRIASICDFFMYLRYLKQGLIKRGLQETYWEVIRLRKKIALARLGLGQCSSCCLHCTLESDGGRQVR
ncbi:unnamed protein product [Soboliphyme baturini]|uniref:Sec2p domain-containing protein n=1 Tax=Soboliphyme baturini TaxID=241478 RepID=A0A183II24_9BILA|nr:unnamed protein product [Soboliphyme baturini]